MLVIVVGGVASGKTTLCSRLPGAILHQDNYYKRGHRDVDSLDALDGKLLRKHVGLLLRGKPVRSPNYNFQTFERRPGEVVNPAPVIVVEGHMAGLLLEPLVRHTQTPTLQLFLDVPEEIRLQRRLFRDTTERGRTPTQVLQQHNIATKPAHELFVEAQRSNSTVIMSMEEGCQQVDAFIEDCKRMSQL